LARDSRNKENLKCVVFPKRSGGRMSHFVYFFFFLEAFDIHYVLCFNKGIGGLVVKCKSWFKEMMTSSKGLGHGSYGKVGVVVNILLSNCVCKFVLLGERIPMWLGATRSKLLFWKKFNLGKCYGIPKHCFIFVTLLGKLSKSQNMLG
jgi:hypothetical protein